MHNYFHLLTYTYYLSRYGLVSDYHNYDPFAGIAAAPRFFLRPAVYPDTTITLVRHILYTYTIGVALWCVCVQRAYNLFK